MKSEEESNIKYLQVSSQEEVDEYIRKYISPDDEGERMSFSFNSKGEPHLEDNNRNSQTYEEMIEDLSKKPMFREVMEHIKKEVKEEE